MKKRWIPLLLLCVSSLGPAEEKRLELNTMVAIVNETPILKNTLDLRRQMIEKQWQARQMPLPTQAALEKQALNQLIMEQVQLQLAHNRHLEVSPFQVTAQIQKIAEDQKISVPELYVQVAQAGLARDTYRQQLQTQMIIHELVQTTLAAKITVSPEEVQLYRQSQLAQNTLDKLYRVENIIIPLPVTPSRQQVQEAEKKATQQLREINAGKISFESAALADSAGESALQGGDLGFRPLAELPEIYAEHLIHLQVGEVYGPLRAGNGIQLIKLVAVKDQAQHMTDEQIREALFKRKLDEAYPLWINSLESQAYIKRILVSK